MKKVVSSIYPKLIWLLLILLAGWGAVLITENPAIKVGVLHSLTGAMSRSERPVLQATQMAIDEINAAGGVLNRPIEPVVADGGSQSHQFAAQAEQLIQRHGVAAIFGCWTSSARKAVLPIIEKHHSALFYPVQYEGGESSAHIVYSAEVPNQQVLPAISWLNQHVGQKMVLVGSDYLYPRAVNQYIKKVAELLGMFVLAEVYFPLDYDQPPDLETLLALNPDVIINTLNGQVNARFFSALNRLQSVDSESFIPVMSFSLSDTETRTYWQEQGVSFAGHYSSWGYHSSIDRPENKAFIARYQARYGEDKRVNSPMVNAYNNVYLWKLAVERAGSVEPETMIKHLAKVGHFGPAGKVFVDAETLHTWKPVFIAQFDQTGRSEVVWQGPLIQPKPYYDLLMSRDNRIPRNE